MPAARECLLVRLVSGGKCQGQALVHCTAPNTSLCTGLPGSTATKECDILPAVFSSKTLKDYRYYLVLLECEQSPYSDTYSTPVAD